MSFEGILNDMPNTPKKSNTTSPTEERLDGPEITQRDTAPYNTATSNIHFELTKLIDLQIEQLSDAWQQLSDNALEPNPVFSPIMLKLAFEKLTNSRQDYVLLQARDGEKLIAIFVLNTHPWKNKFGPAWSFWVHLYSFCSLPLIHAEYSAVVFEALFLWLETNSSKAVLILPLLPSEGPLHDSLSHSLLSTKRPYHIIDAHQRAVMVTRLSGEDYLAESMGHKRRKEYRRQRNRLSEQGQLTLSTISKSDNINTWSSEFFGLEENGWKGKKGSAITCKPDDESYMREMLSEAHSLNELIFWRMSLDDEPIAMAFAYRSGNKVWLLKITYSETYAKYSPGVLLILDITRSLGNDKTIELVDSCAIPDHPMINHIWRERIGIHDVLISTTPRYARFELIVRLEVARRKLRLWVKNIYHYVKGSTK